MAVSPVLIPEDEAERLQSLRQYDIANSLHEAVFDEFVELTARIFSLPISLIALVEEEEVYYKANYGMPGNDEQPREEALCSTAILRESAVVYKDLTTEEDPHITARARQAALDNKIRFYAAAPLRMPDHRNIGTLCIIAREPRTFDADEQAMLEQLAALVSQTVAVRHLCLSSPAGELRWHSISTQLQEEVQALTALIRYMFARQGSQVPVPADSLAQVSRRLLDVQEILSQYRG